MIRFLLLSFIILALISCGEKNSVLDGYQDKLSYSSQDTIHVFLNSSLTGTSKVKLYNIQDETVDEINTTLSPQNVKDTAYWWRNGFKYTKTFDYFPTKLASGIYYFENSSPFVIKNSREKNDVLVVYPTNTVNAYNNRGGRSFYSKPMGEMVSFKRPAKLQPYTEGFLKWITKQPFETDYICDYDLENFSTIKQYKVIIIIGHSEYWTRTARLNFDRFIEEGGHSIILSGNTMWWQVRYHEDKLICYKNAANDSLADPLLKTVNWDDSIVAYPIKNSIGASFRDGGYGLKKDSGWNGYAIIKTSPLFLGTGINLGDTLNCPSTEFDGVLLNDHNNRIRINNSTSFHQYSILGYDIGVNGIKEKSYMPLLVFQKTPSSGIVINTCSTDWCSDGFLGKDSLKIQKLTYNFIEFLLKGKNVFE